MSENRSDPKIVVRDFPAILGFLVLFTICTAFLIGISKSDFASGGTDEPVRPVLFLLVMGAVFFNALRLSLGGIKIRNGKVSYYVSVTGIPLFRKNIDAEHIIDLSSEIRRAEGTGGKILKTYLTNISGVDFQCVISWQSRGSRDRFLSVMKYMYPNITVHRLY